MVVSVDPARAEAGDVAAGERQRLQDIASRFSREDLMRAFDLLAKTEQDIRIASQPRYHFEMMLLRWMHLRKLIPLTELIESLGNSQVSNPKPQVPVLPALKGSIAPAPKGPIEAAPKVPVAPAPKGTTAPTAGLKDAFLAEIRAGKGFFYNTVVAQAQRIEVGPEAITFTFLPTHRALREQFDETRAWLEGIAERLAGRRVAVMAVQSPSTTPPPADETPKVSTPARGGAGTATDGGTRDLKAEAMSSSAVQAMLDVFPAEIRDVEEM
jgi:DNA polymerase III gamma/tau subunit